MDLKELGEKLQKDFHDFKQINDERLKKLEAKGFEPAEAKEKLAKVEAALDASEKKLEGKIEEVKTIMSRIQTVKPEDAQAEIEMLAKQGMTQSMRKNQPMTAEQFKAYQKLMETHLGADNAELKTLSVGSNVDGGYFVRPTISSMISKKVFESSPMRALADSITIGSDSFEELYDDGEAASGWVGETQTRSETDSNQVKMIRIFAHELHASPKASQKILDDSAIDIESWHAGKVVEKFARDEATAFISGTGVNKPKGILGYAAGDGFDKIEQVNSGVSGGVTADKLIELQDALLEDFSANATWLMNRSMWTTVRKLKDSQNQYLAIASHDLTSGDSFSLLGKPVKKASDMPVAAASSLSIAYGDFKKGYLIVDRVGVRVLRDPYTSKGFVLFYTTKRVGGGVRNFQAIKLMKLI